MSSLPDRTRRYGLALLAIALSALLRWALPDVLSRAPYLGFYPGVVLAAMLGGTGPGLVATFGSLVLVQFVFVQFDLFDYGLQMRNAIWIVGGTGVSLVAGWLRTARSQAEQAAALLRQREAESRRQKDLLGVTLASIGDAVIVTDTHGRVTFLNGEAERLTGWTSAAAAGQPLATVFRIINEGTRQTVESPVDKVLRLGSVVGLANHTVLIARDGREIPIDDSGAPIRQADGTMAGVVLVFRDFSERKAAEAALREGEQQFRILTENLQSAVALIDEHGAFLIVNSSFLRVFDIPQDASILNVNSRDWSQWQVFDETGSLLNVDEHPVRKAALTRMAVKNQLVAVQSPSSTDLKWLLVSAEPILDAQGGIHRLICTYYDITERKRTEEALKLTQASIDGAAEMVAWFTPDGSVYYVNDATCRTIGYSREELLKMNALDFSPGFTKEQYEEHWREVRERKSFVLEPVHRRKDGSTYTAEVLVNHVVYGGREFIFAYGRDISDRKRAEEELRESERRYRAIGESIDYGVWVCEPDGRNIYASDSFLKLVGMTQQQCSEFGWGDVLHPDDCEATIAAWKECVRTGGPWYREHRFKGADGRWHPVLACGVAVRNEHGEITSWAGINLDISRLKQAEQNLKDLNESLERRVAERTAVAEVRASQLRMLAEQLTQAEQRERQRIAHILHEHFQQLLVGAKFSLSMVQPKDASSQESLQRTDQVLAEAVEASRSLAVELSPPILRYGGLAPALGWLGQWMHEKNGLKVEVLAEAHVATPAEDVQVLLFQAVRELLLNVVKHAKVDQAKVELKMEADRFLRLTVSDNGVGFHTDPFVAKACTPGGFGLFSIRERLSFLDGRVDIQSAPGAGTCVSLLVPLPPATGASATAEATFGGPAAQPAESEHGVTGLPTTPHAKIGVLIADDHAVVRDGLSRLLQTLPDMEVIGLAKDGREAVELALELGPDVVIMDVSMPELNGIEATRRILADLPTTRIIGLSMHTDQDVAAQMRQAGAVDYRAKTGATNGLVAAIRACARKK